MSDGASKITFFSKAAADLLHASLTDALKAVEAKHGLAITIGSMKYSTENCVAEIECATRRDDGEILTREAIAYRAMAASHGFDPKFLFQSFTAPDGKRFKLMGLNPKARANPFVIRADDGTIYSAPESMIRAGFGVPNQSL